MGYDHKRSSSQILPFDGSQRWTVGHSNDMLGGKHQSLPDRVPFSPSWLPSRQCLLFVRADHETEVGAGGGTSGFENRRVQKPERLELD